MPADTVGRRGPHELSAQQMRLERAAGTRGATGGNDDHIPTGRQTVRDGRQQGEGCGRRIATGHSDRSRAGQLVPLPGSSGNPYGQVPA